MCNCQLLGYLNSTFRRGSLLYGLAPTVSRLTRSVLLRSHITYSDSRNVIKYILRNLRRPSRIRSFIRKMCGKCFDLERHLCAQYILKVVKNVLIHEYCVSVSSTRVGTLIVATKYLQLIQNRYKFRSFTVLQCSHQYCVQPVASDVEVVGYL